MSRKLWRASLRAAGAAHEPGKAFSMPIVILAASMLLVVGTTLALMVRAWNEAS